MRHLTSDHHAKGVSRISALTATFQILRGSGDSPAQTGQSRALHERQSSLWQESLSPSPRQLGSIQSLNSQRAGDFFSLAVWTPRWTVGWDRIPSLQGIFADFGLAMLGCSHASSDECASFCLLAEVALEKQQGILVLGAGNLESPCREFPLAQRARPERRIPAYRIELGLVQALRQTVVTPAKPGRRSAYVRRRGNLVIHEGESPPLPSI